MPVSYVHDTAAEYKITPFIIALEPRSHTHTHALRRTGTGYTHRYWVHPHGEVLENA